MLGGNLWEQRGQSWKLEECTSGKCRVSNLQDQEVVDLCSLIELSHCCKITRSSSSCRYDVLNNSKTQKSMGTNDQHKSLSSKSVLMDICGFAVLSR